MCTRCWGYSRHGRITSLPLVLRLVQDVSGEACYFVVRQPGGEGALALRLGTGG